MDYTNKEFTLDDGNTYVVIEQVDVYGHTYLYIANSANEEDTKYVEIKDNEIVDINPVIFDNDVLPLFLDKFDK